MNSHLASRNCPRCSAALQNDSTFCGMCGTKVKINSLAGSTPAGKSTATTPPGWYADPYDRTSQRYWDGEQWTSNLAPGPQYSSASTRTTTVGTQPKSAGLALFFEILFPGAGMGYLGFTDQAKPFLIASAIGTVLAVSVFLGPISLIIYLACVLQTAPNIGDLTRKANEGCPL